MDEQHKQATAKVKRALQENPACQTGLLGSKRVVGTRRGPSGTPELLAVLYADDPSMGLFYGHILCHPERSNTMVALLCNSSLAIDAAWVSPLFQRFHQYVKNGGEYCPCVAGWDGEVYQEAHSFDGAVEGLIDIIETFDPRRQYLSQREEASRNMRLDLRIVFVYEPGWCRK